MEKLNFRGGKRDWSLYHRIERRQKSQILKRLPIARSFKILGELYRLSYSINANTQFNILDMDKIETLVRVHNIFGKVKS